MKVTIKDITKLSHTTDDIFNKFFIAEPTAQHDQIDINGRYIIGKTKSLNLLLDLINDKYIKTEHFNNTKDAKKHLDKWLKETNEIKNLKDYGENTISGYERTEKTFYIYQLTEYAASVIDTYNENETSDYNKILYKKESNG